MVKQVGGGATPEGQMAEVETPRELHAMGDIRLIMIELGKQDVRLTGIEKATEKLTVAVEKAVEKIEAAVEKQIGTIKDDLKPIKTDIDQTKQDISYAKGAIRALSIIGPILILVLSAVAAALARKWIG